MGKSTTNNTTDSKQGEARPPCDYRNKECAAYGYTIGSRWVCTKHVCEQLQQCWLNARTPRASLAAVEEDAQVSLEAVTQAIEAACEDYRVSHNARIAILNAVAAVSSLLPAEPPQDDGWVTFGRVKVDIENETETFERIPPAEPRQEGETGWTPEEYRQKFCPNTAHPETPVVARECAEEIEREIFRLGGLARSVVFNANSIEKIITRYLVGTPDPCAAAGRHVCGPMDRQIDEGEK